MKTISYEAIGNVTATFFCEEEIKEGSAVELVGAQTVQVCREGKVVCGVSGKCHEDVVAVQMRGFAEVPFSGTLGAGSCNVVGDGLGGIKDGEGKGTPVMVISINKEEKTAVIWL